MSLKNVIMVVNFVIVVITITIVVNIIIIVVNIVVIIVITHINHIICISFAEYPFAMPEK